MKLNSKYVLQVGMWIVVLLATFYWTGETMVWIIKNNVQNVPIAFFVIPPLMFIALLGMLKNLSDLSDFELHKDQSPAKISRV